MWTREGSWTSGTPNFGSIAFFGSTGSGTIWLRESNDPGSVSVGTILINSPNFGAFSAGASAATIDFGDGGVFRNNSGAVFSVPGTVSNVISGNLGLQATSGELVYECSIHGAGSVTVGPGLIHLGGQSTYSGGARILASTAVFVNENSVLSGGTIVSGPFGTGTVTLLPGGSVASFAELLLHNSIVAEAASGAAFLSSLPLIAASTIEYRGTVRALVGGATGTITIGAGGDGDVILNEIIATNWTTSSDPGRIILAHDNSTTLTGAGTVLAGITEVAIDGALGNTAHPT